jgi:hypothetical protein
MNNYSQNKHHHVLFVLSIFLGLILQNNIANGASMFSLSSNWQQISPLTLHLQVNPKSEKVKPRSSPKNLVKKDKEALSKATPSSKVSSPLSYLRRLTRDIRQATSRQKMTHLGLSAMMLYGFICNVSSGTVMSIAWYAFSKRTGLSPLSPGQWKGFVGVNAGVMVVHSLLRPLWIGLTIALTPYFNEMASWWSQRWNMTHNKAVTVLGIFANTVVAMGLMGAGIGSASLLSGVPLWTPRV